MHVTDSGAWSPRYVALGAAACSAAALLLYLRITTLATISGTTLCAAGFLTGTVAASTTGGVRAFALGATVAWGLVVMMLSSLSSSALMALGGLQALAALVALRPATVEPQITRIAWLGVVIAGVAAIVILAKLSIPIAR